MNKIAILVLAANAPEVLDALIHAPGSDKFNFYVHLDSKRSAQDYCLSRDLSTAKFISNRVDVFWGGFNMIRATIELIKAALAEDQNKIFCLISDDSFYLISPDFICEQLYANPNRMDCWHAAQNSVTYGRYQNFYYFDSQPSTPKPITPELRKIDSSFVIGIQKLLSVMRSPKPELDLYCGSQWWSLHREVVSKIIDFLDSNKEISDAFEFSAIPDEILFQTLTMKLCRPLDLKKSPMLYDFNRNPKPFIFSDESELANLNIEDKLFIRKINIGSDFILKRYLDNIKK